MYAIVDIETTGGYAAKHRIIEVAIHVLEGNRVIEKYETLVNPERLIPFHISALTGINNEMVQDAPTFAEIADKVAAITQDRVFVAHNVNFDFSFIKNEFQAIGRPFQRKKLCTVRMSRKLLPGLPSYSLGKLCASLNIRNKRAHRAGGDTEATVKLLKLLISKDKDGHIEQAIKRTSREATLPANLPKEKFTTLPQKEGVYYFKDQKGKVLYVGKAKNLKSRITSHFTGDRDGWQKQNFLRHVYDVDYDLTGNELLALLLEAHQIKKHWPKYNKAQKQQHRFYGLVHYEDRRGYQRLGINRVKKTAAVLLSFHTMIQARSFLWRLIDEHNLCSRLCGLQTTAGPCFEHGFDKCLGACVEKEEPDTYNPRVLEAMETIRSQQNTFAIVGSGRRSHESSVVLMENGNYLGFGYFDSENDASDFEFLKQQVTTHYDSQEARSIVWSHLRTNRKDRVVYFGITPSEP